MNFDFSVWEHPPADSRVYEPVAMTPDEVLQWYMEQPVPFRKKNIGRIRELTRDLLVSAILAAVDECFPIPKKKKGDMQ